MLNQLLGGRYRVVQALGEGGLAKTYIAEDHHRPGHPKCAVKFLKLANNDPKFLPTARRLFNKEAEILEKLGHHAQIPQSFAYFEENQRFYLVQEFIEGYTLNAELPKGYRWSESKVIEMLQDVLPILKFVHSFGVIHRDIKPNNLIRRHHDGRLVLIDFGAVKQVSTGQITIDGTLTQPTITIGTQGYMPAEQVRGKPRLNSDIYALGMICIQALTGIHPIYLEENDDGEIVWQKEAKVSDRLAAILTKMVRYHFQDRYQYATEVLQALQSISPQLAFVQASPDIKQTQLEADSKFKLQETKDYLEMDPWTPWNPNAVSETELRETKVALECEQPTPEVSNHEEKKIDLVFSANLSSSSANIDSSPEPIFVPLNKFRLLIGAGIASILIGVITGYTYMARRQSYLQTQGILEQIKVLKLDKKYHQCVQQAEIFPENYSDLYSEVVTLLQECQQGQAEAKLAEAIELAKQNRFSEAIALSTGISTATNIYSQARQHRSQWSENIFQIASDRYQDGNLQAAMALMESIPADSPVGKKAKTIARQWDEEWQQNQAHLQVAQKALDERRWQDALNAVDRVSDTAYWQKQSQPIIQKAEAEIATARAAASSETYKPSPRPRSRSTSNSPRSKSVPRANSTSSRSRSVSRSRPTRPLSKLVPRSRSIPPRPELVPHSRSIPPRPESVNRSSSPEWICLNNPNPKCRR